MEEKNLENLKKEWLASIRTQSIQLALHKGSVTTGLYSTSNLHFADVNALIEDAKVIEKYLKGE